MSILLRKTANIFVNMNIYHKDIYLPEKYLKTVIGNKISLNYSYHAKREIVNDKYGLVKPLTSILISGSNVIELYVNDWNNVFKILARTSQEQGLDSCLVINIMESLVVTTWLCKSTDTHKTLDKSKYSLK